MLTPINKHLVIEPVAFDSFVASDKTSYEEIGVVVAVAAGVEIPIGARVYFDSWLAKKYPVEGQPDKFYWFVSAEDIVCYEALPE